LTRLRRWFHFILHGRNGPSAELKFFFTGALVRCGFGGGQLNGMRKCVAQMGRARRSSRSAKVKSVSSKAIKNRQWSEAVSVRLDPQVLDWLNPKAKVT
jgi:hypothetical protein